MGTGTMGTGTAATAQTGVTVTGEEGLEALLALADRVVDRAGPGEAIEAYVAEGVDTDIRAYQGEVESFTAATSAGIGIRVVRDHRVGFAWAGSLDDAVVAETVEAARDNAAFATPDDHVMLAEPDATPPIELDLWDAGLAEVDATAKVALALALEAQARGAHPEVRQVSSADYGDSATSVALVSTTGVRAASRRTSAYASVSVLAGDAAATQTGTGFSVGRGFAALDPDRAVADAVERAVRLLGATKVPSGRMTVVFDRRVASTLLAVLSSALSGEAVAKGRSFFAGRIGELIADPVFTLVDDPTDPRAFGAARYDGEGLPCRRNVLIERGHLRRFVYDTVSGSRAGVPSTGSAVRGGFSGTPGPGCRALTVEPDGRGWDEAQVVASVGDGLFVQSVTGVHSGVNPVSGDFSVGAEGLVIRDGRFAGPVREVTVASTLQRMLQSIVAIGSDREWLPGVAAGQTLAVADMQISGS